MTKKKETYNEHYWEKGRNGYFPNQEASKGLNFDWHLDKVTSQIVNLLKEKNEAYGNTALNPAGIFSKLNSTEAICARLDDKLSRIKNRGINDKTEDTVDDIIGYLLLLKMSLENK